MSSIQLFPALKTDSPFRLYPETIPQRLRFTLDGMAVTFDMLSASFTRLYQVLALLSQAPADSKDPTQEDLAIGDTWSFINAAYQFLLLANGVQGDRSASISRKDIQSLAQVVERQKMLRRFRDDFQHMNNDLASSPPDAAFMGTLFWQWWVGEAVIDFHSITSGSVRDGQRMNLSNNSNLVGGGPFRTMEFEFRGTYLDLFDYYQYCFVLMIEFEKNLDILFRTSPYVGVRKVVRSVNIRARVTVG